MNQEQIGKHTIQSFRLATYHICVFNIACARTCKCDPMPFPSRPDTTKLDCVKYKSRKPILLLVKAFYGMDPVKWSLAINATRSYQTKNKII